MQIQKGFQCTSCHSFLSHPIDACPVCADQFYWLVVTREAITQTQVAAFVAAMVNVAEGRVTEAFLTHGERLWLPYNFWAQDPAGASLDEFPWIADLELFQHAAGEVDEAVATAVYEPKPWETLPKQAVPDFSGYTPSAPESASVTQSMPVVRKREPDPVRVTVVLDETVSEPSLEGRTPSTASEPSPEGRPPAPRALERTPSPASGRPGRAAGGTKKPSASGAPAGFQAQLSALFVPLMIFLFLLLLSLSYLALRYHKNQMVPQAPSQSSMEDVDERPLLS